MCFATYLDFIPLLNLSAVPLDDLLVFVSQVIQYLCQVFTRGSIDLHAHVATGLRLQLSHFLQRETKEHRSFLELGTVDKAVSRYKGMKIT